MAYSRITIYCCLLLLCRVQGAYFQTLRQRKSAEDDILEPIWKHILTMPATSGERGLATPMFWHIHKSGGSTVHDVLGSCLNLTVASHIGVDNGHGADQVRINENGVYSQQDKIQCIYIDNIAMPGHTGSGIKIYHYFDVNYFSRHYLK
jgi:hypothetical protein